MSPEGTVNILETYKYQPRYDVLNVLMTCSSDYLEVECLFVWFVLGVLRGKPLPKVAREFARIKVLPRPNVLMN